MPNWIVNQVHLIGEDSEVAKVLDFIKGNNGDVDFNKIVPMPKIFRDYDTTNHPDGQWLEIGKPVGWEKDSPIVTDELIAEYKWATKKQRELYGVVGWYDWSCRYWGTKWNACESYAEDNAIYFDTAWSAPLPILERLSQLFPDIEFHFVFADEDAGFNTGEGTFIDGELVRSNFPDGDTPDAWEMYFETHNWARDYYVQQEDGTYRCKE